MLGIAGRVLCKLCACYLHVNVLPYPMCACMCVHRQVEVLIQELVVLVQRSEEYTYFLTSHMRDAVNRDTEKQQAAAAAAHRPHLQRRLSGAQPDTPAGRDQQGDTGRQQLWYGCWSCTSRRSQCARYENCACTSCRSVARPFSGSDNRYCYLCLAVLLCVLQLCWTLQLLRSSSTWGSVKRACAQVGIPAWFAVCLDLWCSGIL